MTTPITAAKNLRDYAEADARRAFEDLLTANLERVALLAPYPRMTKTISERIRTSPKWIAADKKFNAATKHVGECVKELFDCERSLQHERHIEDGAASRQS